MVIHPKTAGPAGPAEEKKNLEPRAGAGSDETCRCKEASEMTPRQLLRLMIDDLAFWKKAKQR